MNEEVLVNEESRGLGQMGRVVNTFVAPTETFRDILRSAAWWLPFVLMVVFSIGATYAIDRKVGFDRVAENQINASQKQQEAMSELTPQERAAQMHRVELGVRYSSYGTPVIVVIWLLIYAGIMLGSFNFGLGARMSYGQCMAVTMYASLPYLLLRSILTMVTVWFGNNAEGFSLQNPIGTNLAYYLSDAAPWLKALLMQFDVLALWTLVLTVVGMKTVAKVKTGPAAAVVIGWWLLLMIVTVAATAALA